MITDDIKAFLGQDWDSVAQGMRTYLDTDISLLNDTNMSILSHSGKQIRPLVSLLMAKACRPGPANEDSVRYAVASELLHNATLLHDDVADESDMRRGKPTVRALMGPSASVLVGDFWLVRAVRAVLDSKVNEKTISIFASTLSDLAEGEMFQLQKASSCDTTKEDYLRIIYCKTASLFVAGCLAGAISVNAEPLVEKAASEYGRCLGMAFQVRDDILDYMPGDTLGKPVGVDVLERKITLPLLCALESVTLEEQERIRAKVRDITPEERDRIISFVRSNGGIEAAQKVLSEYSAEAVKALDVLPQSREKEWLVRLASVFTTRTV